MPIFRLCSNFFRKTNLIALGGMFIVSVSVNSHAAAAAVSKMNINDDDYLLIDVSLRGRILIESLEVYRVDDTYLIPVIAFVGALELKNDISLTDGKISITVDDKERRIDLVEQDSNFNLDNHNFWANDEFDIYVDADLLGGLIDADTRVTLSTLSINIRPANSTYLFPNEKRFSRSQTHKNTLITTIENGDIFTGDKVILDQYHLISPPTGSVSLRAINKSEDGSSYSGNIQLNNDLFYHSAYLSLSQSKNSELSSYLAFSRTKSSPYQKLPFGISLYGFGDVSSNIDSFKPNSDNGVGAYFYSKELVKTRNFGTTYIEGNATPGWEVELYSDGYFVSQQVVNERGRYRFDDLETHYGTNNFTVKLFGPHGEEEVRVETLIIDGNRLKKGENSFDGGFLESGSILLQGALEDGYNPDSFHFNYDVGLSDKFQLGVSMAQRPNAVTQNDDQFIGLKLQSSFNDLLINSEYMQVVDGGAAGLFSGQGRINKNHRYGFRYNFEDDFSSNVNNINTVNNKRSDIGILFSGKFNLGIPFSYRFNTETNFLANVKRVKVNTGLSWNYNHISYSSGLVFTPDFITGKYAKQGVFSMSGKIGEWRLSNQNTFNFNDGFDFEQLTASLTRRFDNDFSLNTQLQYRPNRKKNSQWALETTTSWALEQMHISASANINANDEWQVALGINFSIGYDHINNRVNISRRGIYGGSTLDLNAYLDRNSNLVLDEGDLALSGAEFGPMSSWRDRKTAPNGRVVLQGVPVNHAVGFYGNWNEEVTPSLNSYNVYTHSGGYIQEDIPFTLKTDVSGYVTVTKKGELGTASNIAVELIGESDQILAKTIANFEGFFEFNGLVPGHYKFRIAKDALSVRHLRSTPEYLLLTTPQRGGYIELGDILLSPENDGNEIEIERVVILSEDNYDPAFFEGEHGGEIYVKPQNMRGKAKNYRVELLSAGRIDSVIRNKDHLNAQRKRQRKSTTDEKVQWRIQFAAFKSQERAQTFVDKNSTDNYGLHSEPALGGLIYRIYSENFDSYSQAKHRLSEYAIADVNPILVRVKRRELKVQAKESSNNIPPNQTAFTIQLMVLSKRALIDQAISSFNQNEVYVAASSNGQYVISFGRFDTKKQATITAERLLINSNSYWVRPIKTASNRILYNEFRMGNN